MITQLISSASKAVRTSIIISAIAVLIGGAPSQLLVLADSVTPTGTTDSTGTSATSSTTSPSAATTNPTPTTSSPSTTATTTPPDPSATPSTPSTTPATSSGSPTINTTTTPPTTSSAPTTASNTIGTTAPTGADANTYALNPATGNWENQYYIWNPTTGQATPKTPLNYSYNPATGIWDSTQWLYDAPSGTYKPNIVSTSTPPAAVTQQSLASPDGTPNSVGLNTSTNGTFNNFYNASISNSIMAQALSGNANVLSNTLGGSALTGNAQSMATILNMLQSSTGLGGPGTANFVSNVYGDIQGNLIIDPTMLLQNLNGNAAVTQTTSNNIVVNNQSTGQIANNVNLAATSGNATVANNTTGGNATSGSATAIANVINMLNSMISAKQSFVGVVNVYGNLSGDILMPQDLLSALIASNEPSTNINVGTNTTNNANANLASTTNIANNLKTSATSGSATVSQNTGAGNATTGTASTNVTVFNLTGNQVIGADTILVFVNVLGKWVGVLMNAPSGSTAAAYGSNLTQNSTVSNNVNLSSASTNNITNNITTTATSGDASVTHNTTAGNATSGDAHAAINLANLSNDQFALSNWFGVLFINIFGNWFGSFGALTPASSQTGATQSASSTASTPTNTAAAPEAAIFGPHLAVFRFVPATSSTPENNTPTSSTSPSTSTPTLPQAALIAQHVLGTATVKPPKTTKTSGSHGISGQTIIAAVMVATGLSVLGAEQFIRFHNHA